MLLVDVAPLTAEEIAGVARSVALAAGRLHAGGRPHGAIDAQHVEVRGEGQVTLVPAASTPAEGASIESDVRAIGELITDLLDGAGAGTPPGPRRQEPDRPAFAIRLSRLGRLLSGLSMRRSDNAPSAEAALRDIARLASGGNGPQPSAASLAALLTLRIPRPVLPAGRRRLTLIRCRRRPPRSPPARTAQGSWLWAP